jgi:hypothetical protein
MEAFMRIPVLPAVAVSALLALPAVAAPSMQGVDKAAATITACVPVIRQAAVAQAPSGYAAAQSELWAMRLGHLSIFPKLSAEHEQFTARLSLLKSQLTTCGVRYSADVPAAETLLKGLDPAKLSGADQALVEKSFGRYHAARQQIEDALAFADRYVEASLRPTLEQYFLRNSEAGK